MEYNPAEHRPIFIMGYMASGKTTFGRALARAVNRQFIDLDFHIEQRYHRTVSQIFAERGETGFRDLETRMLREVSAMEDVIVACGGGTPCFNDNMDTMERNGATIWLEATPERIVERLIINRSRRPLMADKTPGELLDAVEAGLAARQEFYCRARIHFNGDRLEDRSQIDETIGRFLNQHADLFHAR